MMSVIVRDREGKSLLLRKEHRMFFANESNNLMGDKQQPLSELYRKSTSGYS